MAATALDRVSRLLVQLGNEKIAMDDPGGMNGASSHPSAKGESEANERSPTEGAQTADNAAYIKENIQGYNVDSATALTFESAPKDTEQQITNATPVGEDPANEDDYKGTKENPETSHVTGGDVGAGKYGSITPASLKALSDDNLYKLASDLGNEILADAANGRLATKTAAAPGANPTTTQAAAAAGHAAAGAVSNDEQIKLGAAVIADFHNAGVQDALLVAAHVREKYAAKVAEEAQDPTGGAAEGEDNGSGKKGLPPEEGGEAGPPGMDAGPGAGAGSDLLAAMAGGAGGGAPMPGGGDPLSTAGGPPPEMAGMGNDQALQQLAMALMELGIDPAALAAAAGGGGGGMPGGMPGGPPPGGLPGGPPPGPPGGGGMPPPDMGAKLAKLAMDFRRSGKFEVSGAKTAAERKVRNFMKGYILELAGHR